MKYVTDPIKLRYVCFKTQTGYIIHIEQMVIVAESYYLKQSLQVHGFDDIVPVVLVQLLVHWLVERVRLQNIKIYNIRLIPVETI